MRTNVSVLLAVALGLVASSLEATCTCTLTSVVVDDAASKIFISGKVTGSACGLHNTITFKVDESFAGEYGCLAETCELNNVQASIACLSTGQHLVRATCSCGQLGTRPDGTPICLNDTGNASQALPVDTTPDVSLAVGEISTLGEGSLSIPFSFPNTTGPGARLLRTYVDGHFDKMYSPADRSATWEPPLKTTCWREGDHEIAVVATACNLDSDPLFRDVAATTVAVHTKPETSVSVSGPDAAGEVTPSVSYNFENTDSRVVDLYVDGGFDDRIFPAQASGTWAVPPLSTACWSQGTHDVASVAVACQESQDPDYRTVGTTTFVVDHEPGVSLSVSGGQATVNYSFPQTAGSTQRSVRLRLVPFGALVDQFSPSEREGQRTVDVSCAPETGWVMEATATACGAVSKQAFAALPQCPKPPRQNGCNEQQGPSCGGCTGPGGGVPVGGGGPAIGGEELGPGARMFYLAGGVGSPGNPGEAAWNATLGWGWAHSYSERIVQDASDPHRAWWLTQYGSFRRYTDSNSDGVYESVSPEDEYRTLTHVGSGWEIRDLEGTVTTFDSAGLWLSTHDRHGNTKTATYTGGRLASVSFPDGRSETFSYAASGKLASITEIGIDGVAQRVWLYTWSGNDLVRVDRPDGTAYRFVYGSAGYMTRSILVGAGGERIEKAWEYDTEGNVVRAWRGADDFASGVERYELAYDHPVEPTQTTVTIYRNATEADLVVYTLSRTASWVGAKPRVTSIAGDCPSCGLGPGSQLFYEDAANPLLPTRIIDGRGIETHFTYDTHGRVVTKTEAAGTPASRTTSSEYDATFPALATRIEMPSTSGGSALRKTVNDYDTEGNLTSRHRQGSENGSFFDLETIATFNGAGQPLSIDPPGHGTADQTAFTYDPARADLIPLTRTEPLIGPTTFEHDAFNRRTAVIDPNGLRTETTYDALNRATSITRLGAGPAENLVTSHTYNGFGDLFRTTLPLGNVIEYGYDTAGRLISIERKPDASTPGERTIYTLDGVGNRIKEEIQKWNGTAWVTESFTDFIYSTRCHLDKTIHADGSVTENAYDCAGNLEKVWDARHPRNGPNDPTQLYEYDELNRLIRLRQPWAGGGEAVTRYSYDVQDHLSSVIDAEGNETLYTYSDRDLMTRQDSPVSGLALYTYDEHGELASQTDARGITSTREVDALDRVTRLDYPDNSLDTTYTYDDPAVPFSKGRLTALSRPGSTIAYAYDRFGRLTQDGVLSYLYDRNGNRTELEYPDGVSARWTYDFADREVSLEIQQGAATPQTIVSGATYKAFGPLAGLTLGNGLVENRSYSLRYFPTRIEVPGRLDQTYTTDAVGNIVNIERSAGGALWASDFHYQDPQYFLTEGNGPWGHQEWAYDRIGNRLSEESADANAIYTYTANASGGHTPKLSRVDPSPGGEAGSFLSYGYDAAGNETAVNHSGVEGTWRTSSLTYSAESRLSGLSTSDGPASTGLLYDGRGFLRRSRLTATNTSDFEQTEPVYSSQGLLLARRYHKQWTHGSDGDPEEPPVTREEMHTTSVFYFAGRPVAQLRQYQTGGGAAELLYLTTDHLGTPILATDAAGALAWEGGLDPFGTPYVFPGADPSGAEDPAAPAEVSATMESAGVFLRFPGQWDDSSFRSHGLRGGGIYYNLYRWYEVGRGRYSQPDPLGLKAGIHLYAYTQNHPTTLVDPDGQAAVSPDPAINPGLEIPGYVATCTYRIAKEYKQFGKAHGWRWVHCMASCEIAKQCGGPTIARMAGYGKEAADTVRCIRDIFVVGVGVGDYCESAMQETDFNDNARGFTCPRDVSCDNRCREIKDRQNEPGEEGPLWGFPGPTFSFP